MLGHQLQRGMVNSSSAWSDQLVVLVRLERGYNRIGAQEVHIETPAIKTWLITAVIAFLSFSIVKVPVHRFLGLEADGKHVTCSNVTIDMCSAACNC